jgi:hypothetical protein
MARSQLGPAAEARPKSLTFRHGRVREKPAIGATYRSGRAYRTAIDPGARDANKEQPVEAGVTRGQRSVARLIIKSHGDLLGNKAGDSFTFHARSLSIRGRRVWPFSDIEMDSFRRTTNTRSTHFHVTPSQWGPLRIGKDRTPMTVWQGLNADDR